jgi:hypothetical protein
MGVVDFLVRNQVVLFVLVAWLAVLSLYVVRRQLYQLEWQLPFELGEAGGTAGTGGVRISVGALLNRLTRREAGYLLVGIFLALSAIGIANPIPQTTGLSLPGPDRDIPQNKKLLIFSVFTDLNALHRVAETASDHELSESDVRSPI